MFENDRQMTETPATTLKLGLIGDNIAQSQAPRLHRIAGRQAGLGVSYDRLVPRDMGLDFEGVFRFARDNGFRGVNVTYPYKEVAAGHVSIPDALVRAIGAVNTVVFTPDGPVGYNTDHSGFIAAYRRTVGNAGPGVVCLIGTGGAGKAVGFGLIALGATVIRCVDADRAKADRLAQALRAAGSPARIEVLADAVAAARGADGVINCTPMGMVGHDGTPLPATALPGARWAFDAVYTPVDTQFLRDAAAAGLTVISGYEMFLGQGLDAWEIFSGRPADPAALRAALAEGGA